MTSYPTTTAHTTRPSLLARLCDANDELAWAEFSAVYEPVIYRMVRSRGIQDADAREIVQEVLVSVSDTIERFDVNGSGSFRGWLSRIARNATIDRMRTIQSRRETIGGSSVARAIEEASADTNRHNQSDQELSQEFDINHRRQLFRWAAGQVRCRTGEKNWIAFWQTAVESRAIGDVARQLGISEGAVYVARCRVLKRIRELVHQRLED